MGFSQESIKKLNAQFKGIPPTEIVSWAVKNSKKAVVTTNFRPYEVALLYAVSEVKNDIPVVWCDTGYNTPNTYKHAEELIETLNLNIDLYVPEQTTAHRDAVMGIPQIDDPRHGEFTEQVKLEPFKRAMAAHKTSETSITVFIWKRPPRSCLVGSGYCFNAPGQAMPAC